MYRLRIAPLMLLCSIGAGCGSSSGSNLCTLDEDCESNFCKADGTCGVSGDAMPSSDAPSDTPSGVCTPNHDGMITRDELPLVAGKMARFRIATNAAFNTAGSVAAGGLRTWDLSGALANDTDTQITLAPPTGASWLADYPDASYATQLAAGSDLLGIFKVDAAAVTLLGVVSPNSGGVTKITYSPPAVIVKLPVTVGASWRSSSTVTGTTSIGLVNYTETYTSNVDEVGTMKTPYGDFPVLRIATDLADVQIVTTFKTVRSFAWMAECFGTVANATSADNATSAELTSVKEVRRLIP